MQNYANLVRLSEACDQMVGKTIRATDLTICDEGNQDVFCDEISLIVTDFDRAADTAYDEASGIFDSYLWVECVNAEEAAKLPEGYHASWVYGPSIDADGNWTKPRFKIVAPAAAV